MWSRYLIFAAILLFGSTLASESAINIEEQQEETLAKEIQGLREKFSKEQLDVPIESFNKSEILREKEETLRKGKTLENVVSQLETTIEKQITKTSKNITDIFRKSVEKARNATAHLVAKTQETLGTFDKPATVATSEEVKQALAEKDAEIARLHAIVEEEQVEDAVEAEALKRLQAGVAELVDNLNGTHARLEGARAEVFSKDSELRRMKAVATQGSVMKKVVEELTSGATVDYETGVVKTRNGSKISIEVFQEAIGAATPHTSGHALTDPAVPHQDFQLMVDFATLLGAAAGCGALVALLGSPPSVGYILGGILVGPSGLRLVEGEVQVETLAQFGSIFILFAHGVQFSYRDYQRFARVSVLGTFLIIAAMAALGCLRQHLATQPLMEGGIMGAAAALSATSLPVAFVHQHTQHDTLHGKLVVGLCASQDLVMAILLSLPAALHDNSPSIVIARSVAVLAMVVLATVYISRALIPWLLAQVLPHDSPYLRSIHAPSSLPFTLRLPPASSRHATAIAASARRRAASDTSPAASSSSGSRVAAAALASATAASPPHAASPSRPAPAANTPPSAAAPTTAAAASAAIPHSSGPGGVNCSGGGGGGGPPPSSLPLPSPRVPPRSSSALASAAATIASLCRRGCGRCYRALCLRCYRCAESASQSVHTWPPLARSALAFLCCCASRLFHCARGCVSLRWPLLRRVRRLLSRPEERVHTREVFLLSVISMCLATSLFTQWVGLSLEVGAFLAGIMLSGTPFVSRVLFVVEPLASVFGCLLFAATGMLISPRFLLKHWRLVTTSLIQFLGLRVVVVTAIVLLFRYPFPCALYTGLLLAPPNELSLVLASRSQALGLASRAAYLLYLAVAVLTLAVAPAVYRLLPRSWLEEWALGAERRFLRKAAAAAAAASTSTSPGGGSGGGSNAALEHHTSSPPLSGEDQSSPTSGSTSLTASTRLHNRHRRRKAQPHATVQVVPVGASSAAATVTATDIGPKTAASAPIAASLEDGTTRGSVHPAGAGGASAPLV